MKDQLVLTSLDIGEKMLESGGEVSRVEDTIARILKAYGFEKVDVFSITSQIQVTAIDSDGRVYTQLRRIHRWGTDLEELERLNQISRDICASTPELSVIREWIREVEEKKQSESGKQKLVKYVGSSISAGVFAIFFGGNHPDAVAAAFLGAVITWMNRKIKSKEANQLLYYFFFSIVTGILGNLIVLWGTKMGFSMNLDKVLIGCIMLSIPGIAITYSVRDMLLGELITGMLRFAESLLITASIAAGYILSTMLVEAILL